jgi:hypothetical protein
MLFTSIHKGQARVLEGLAVLLLQSGEEGRIEVEPYHLEERATKTPNVPPPNESTVYSNFSFNCLENCS